MWKIRFEKFIAIWYRIFFEQTNNPIVNEKLKKYIILKTILSLIISSIEIYVKDLHNFFKETWPLK